jgi:hypothetical protein
VSCPISSGSTLRPRSHLRPSADASHTLRHTRLELNVDFVNGELETVLQHGHPAYTDQEPADQGEREEVGRDGDAERRIGSG